MAESLSHYRYYGIPLYQAMPRVFVAIKIELQFLIDFRDKAATQDLGISLKTVLDADWRKEVGANLVPLSQSLGKSAYEAGLEGMLIPSAADDNGYNLVLFPDNFKNASKISVMKAASLPKK